MLDLGCLEAHTLELRLQSIAKSTTKAYESHWNTFVAFCKAAKRCAIPANPHTIALYIASLEVQGRHKSVAVAIAAIRKRHEFADLPAPTDTMEIKQIKIGIAKKHLTGRVRKVLPLRTADIENLGSKIDRRNIIDLRDFTLIAIMYAGMLRRAEVIAIRVENIKFHQEHVEIELVCSKTDQTGKGDTVVIAQGERKVSCPVRALAQYLAKAQIKSGPLFRRCTATKVTSYLLSETSVGEVVKRRTKEIGLDTTKYSTHSARRGGATSAAMAGVPTRLIKRQG